MKPPVLNRNDITEKKQTPIKISGENGNEVSEVLRISGVNNETKLTINNTFNSFFENVQVWINRAKDIEVTDENQTAEMEHARNIRLKIREIRIEADKVRKLMKDESLRYNKAVQGVYNILEYMIKPVEDDLMKKEKFVEIKEQERKDALAEARVSEMLEYIDLGYVPDGYDYGEMAEEDYKRLLTMGKKMKHEAEKEVNEIEAKRLKEEEAKRKEDERIRAENEHLKKEADEREKAEKVQRAKEAKERKVIEDKARKEREDLEAKAQVEREAKEKLEADNRKREEAESQKAEREAETKRQAELSPDKDKLKAFAESLIVITKPTLQNKMAVLILDKAISDLKHMSDEIIQQAKTI